MHLDLKLPNIMLRIEDQSVLTDYENGDPAQTKVIDKDRTIYASHPLREPHGHAYGPPVLSDFGEARIGPSHSPAHIQPEVYRAPEILMEMDWNHKVDIWNAGCMVRQHAHTKTL
jgi:serine/threonine-protein kinase SRPK3